MFIVKNGYLPQRSYITQKLHCVAEDSEGYYSRYIYLPLYFK